MPIPQGVDETHLEAMSTEYEYYDEDEEWGEGGDGEWEWEAEVETQPEMETNSNLQQLAPLPIKQTDKISLNGSTNLVNGSSGMKTGTGNDNGYTDENSVVHNGNHNYGHGINIEDSEIEEAKGKADIQIQGNLLKIARTGPVEWSDDEYEDDEEEVNTIPIPPPPPPPAPPPPPPPPPPSEMDDAQARKRKRIEEMKKKPTETPDFLSLMKDIDSFRYGFKTKLKKTHCNDRSQPFIGSGLKVQGKYIYESEQEAANSDIFHDIKKGVRLKKTKTNDRSKPVLQGLRSFRRQTTKEERLKKGSTIDDEIFKEEEREDDEDVLAMREDLESTKQLLDLELRSKKLLEKDNKRLAQELEKLKMEMSKGGGGGASGGGGAGSGNTASEPQDETEKKASRRNSVATKRHSVIRLLSESEDREIEEAKGKAADGMGAETGNGNNNCNNEVLDENDEDNHPLTPGYDSKTDFWGTVTAAQAKAEDSVAAAARAAVADLNTFTKPAESFYEEEIAELDEMRDEVDEARELAAEWEAKYKEMQRQMSDVESSRSRAIHSLIIDNVPMIQKKVSATSEFEEAEGDYDDGDYTWMLKREIRSLNNKLRNVRDKRQMVMQERQLLQERIETLVGSIGNEVESRRGLRKEINEMNEAFKEEIMDMAREQKAANELEDCYYSDDEELVVNTHKRDDLDDDLDWDTAAGDGMEVDDTEDSVEDILKEADEDEYVTEVEDAGAELFDNYPESDEEDFDENLIQEDDYDPVRDSINKRVERHADNVQLMRKSNYRMKTKIDRLYDILQMQKEKHHDLRQELTRMLADIQ